MLTLRGILTMSIQPMAAARLISASLICVTAVAAQESRPAAETPPASPQSSHDATEQRPLAPDHSRPLKESDGRTLLWAGGDREGGEDAIWFDMTDALVDPVKFQFGIGKDTIPSIDEPKFATYGSDELAATRITDQTDVIGYVANGVAKAYPLFILDRCEVVNDYFGDDPYAVYW
jgi:hypothetical protein